MTRAGRIRPLSAPITFEQHNLVNDPSVDWGLTSGGDGDILMVDVDVGECFELKEICGRCRLGLDWRRDEFSQLDKGGYG